MEVSLKIENNNFKNLDRSGGKKMTRMKKFAINHVIQPIG